MSIVILIVLFEMRQMQQYPMQLKEKQFALKTNNETGKQHT